MRSHRRYAFFTIAFLSLSVFLYQCHKDYYREYNVVKEELEKVDGVEVLGIDGNPDLALEDIYATIKIKSGDTLTIYSLSKDNFTHTNSISLGRLNNWEFHSTGCTSGGHWGGGSLDIGENSQYPELQKLGVKNVQDIVTHINGLKTIINDISIHPRFDTLKAKDRVIYFQKYDLRQVSNTRELKWAECQ